MPLHPDTLDNIQKRKLKKRGMKKRKKIESPVILIVASKAVLGLISRRESKVNWNSLHVINLNFEANENVVFVRIGIIVS